MSSRGPQSHLSPPPPEEHARGAVADAITSDLVVVTLADKPTSANLTAGSSDGDVALLAFYLVPSPPSAA